MAESYCSPVLTWMPLYIAGKRNKHELGLPEMQDILTGHGERLYPNHNVHRLVTCTSVKLFPCAYQRSSLP